VVKKSSDVIPSGLMPRVMVSAIGSIGVLILVLAYLAFYATGFTTFQSIAIVLVVLLALAALLAVLWVPWGMSFAEKGPGQWTKKWEKYGKKMEKKYGSMEEFPYCGERSPLQKIASKIIGTIILISIIIYLAFYSEGYTLFQNFAIIAIVVLLWGAVKALVYIPSCFGSVSKEMAPKKASSKRKPVRRRKKR
jgi:uncharacterized membrane protein YbhN (UPF0104 family)